MGCAGFMRLRRRFGIGFVEGQRREVAVIPISAAVRPEIVSCHIPGGGDEGTHYAGRTRAT